MEHDDIVKLAINYFKGLGATKVYAAIEEYGEPAEINGFKPDISAYVGSVRHICEIETEESISTEHTKNQCIGLSKSNTKFYVCIPKSVESPMKKNLGEWGILQKTTILTV